MTTSNRLIANSKAPIYQQIGVYSQFASLQGSQRFSFVHKFQIRPQLIGSNNWNKTQSWGRGGGMNNFRWIYGSLLMSVIWVSIWKSIGSRRISIVRAWRTQRRRRRRRDIEREGGREKRERGHHWQSSAVLHYTQVINGNLLFHEPGKLIISYIRPRFFNDTRMSLFKDTKNIVFTKLLSYSLKERTLKDLKRFWVALYSSDTDEISRKRFSSIGFDW